MNRAVRKAKPGKVIEIHESHNICIIPLSGDGVKEVNEGEEGQTAETCQGSVQQEKPRTNKKNKWL